MPLARRLKRRRLSPPCGSSCATASGQGAPGLPHRPAPDRNPHVDRETARKNMIAGLVAGGFAAAIFALSFVVAFLYIAQ